MDVCDQATGGLNEMPRVEEKKRQRVQQRQRKSI